MPRFGNHPRRPRLWDSKMSSLLWLLLQRIVHVFHWNPPIVISFFSYMPDSWKRHMGESQQVAVFGSIREGFLSLFSGLCGIRVKLDANGRIIKLHGADMHKIAAKY